MWLNGVATGRAGSIVVPLCLGVSGLDITIRIGARSDRDQPKACPGWDGAPRISTGVRRDRNRRQCRPMPIPLFITIQYQHMGERLLRNLLQWNRGHCVGLEVPAQYVCDGKREIDIGRRIGKSDTATTFFGSSVLKSMSCRKSGWTRQRKT